MINLKDVLTKYPECKMDSGKLRAYLYDLYPNRDDRKQADLLITVAESGFPEEIDGKQSIKYAHYKKYIDNLVQTTDLNYKQAEDGIKEWMNALSVKADGADSSGMTISPTHVHKYQKTVVQPTCKEMGYTKYWCDCGYEYNDDYKPKCECNYVVYDRKEATCTSAGYVKSKCKWCGNEKNETILVKSHDFDVWQITSQPTCSKQGSKKKVCKICGKEETKTIRTAKHTWSEWNELIHPLCETDGKAARVCSVCGKTEEKVLPKKGHDFSEWQPSTNKKRKFERFCSKCGKYEYSSEFIGKMRNNRRESSYELAQVFSAIVFLLILFLMKFFIDKYTQ